MSNNTLGSDDYRLCQQVAEDLAHLYDSWTDELSEPVIRRESPIIRHLLTEGDYGRAWRLAGLPRQPTVLGHDLDAMLGDFPRHYITFAFPAPSQWTRPAGSGEQSVKLLNPGVPEGDLILTAPGYVEGQGAFFSVVPKDDVGKRKIDDLVNELMAHLRFSYARPFWLTNYLNSAGAYVEGKRITRRQIIDFVVNAMGGAHYDTASSRPSKAASRALLKPLHVKWRGTRDVHAPWIEVMSIGQSVARSTDAMRYRDMFSGIERPSDLDHFEESG